MATTVTIAARFANGAATTTAEAVTIPKGTPVKGVLVGVHEGETGKAYVSLSSSVSATEGAALCGEPIYDGKDCFLDAALFGGPLESTKTFYVIAATGTVNFWVKVV